MTRPTRAADIRDDTMLDDLDVRLRRELGEVGEVFIDVTAHRRREREG